MFLHFVQSCNVISRKHALLLLQGSRSISRTASSCLLVFCYLGHQFAWKNLANPSIQFSRVVSLQNGSFLVLQIKMDNIAHWLEDRLSLQKNYMQKGSCNEWLYFVLLCNGGPRPMNMNGFENTKSNPWPSKNRSRSFSSNCNKSHLPQSRESNRVSDESRCKEPKTRLYKLKVGKMFKISFCSIHWKG